MKNKNFGRKRQAIYILSNRKSTRIIKTLMDFFFFIKVKIKMVCFSVPSKIPVGKSIEEPLHCFFHMEKEKRRERCRNLMELCNLSRDYYTRLPSELSGGEQKRVAIARALAAEPQCLIFDEATNGFDLPLRKKIIDEIIDLQQQLGFTLIFITHDMELAVVVADEIFVMRNSNLVERAAFSGDYSVFHDPYSRMLLEASGLVNTSTDWNDKTKERIDLK